MIEIAIKQDLHWQKNDNEILSFNLTKLNQN